MIKKKLMVFLLFISISCGGNDSDDIYKTKGGDFASKIGNFVADFPTEPNYMAIDNQIGLDKFQIHLFRSTLGPQKIFNVEYIDYPETIIDGLTTEDIYAQGVKNYASKMSQLFNLQYSEPLDQHGLQGVKFQLELTKEAKEKGAEGYVLGRLFRQDNRVYTITYIGENDKNAGLFVNSFRLLD